MAACGSDKRFVSSYMLLKPEEAGLFDLLRILFCRNLNKRNFMECHEYTFEESFSHRWLVFISVLAQKFLQFVADPLRKFGSTVERWLNLFSNNHNVLVLLLNYLRGKKVVPVDKKSAKFLSIVGHLDKRVELDSSIKHEDGKYNAALSMMASKASYENVAYLEMAVKGHWKMELVASGDYRNEFQGKDTTQAFILLDKSRNHDTYVVAFRGTEPFDADAWGSDVDISWCYLPGVGKIHAGFMKALGFQKHCMGWPKEFEGDENHKPAYYAIRDILKKSMGENDEAKFIVTGHSLGGALAILFPAILLLHDETLLLERLDAVYTFGQPRVGDEQFAEYMKKELKDNQIKYYRLVYCNDVVPRLPFDNNYLMFKHFGTCVYYNRRYEDGVVQEEPNKNYFSLWAIIPMMVNAVWELIRSFTIVFTHGSDYKEGWVLIFFRVIGLAVPGLPAHSPQDYVNATRLGSVLSHLDRRTQVKIKIY